MNVKLNTLLKSSDALLKKHHDKKALMLLSRITRTYPDNAKGWTNKGISLLRLNQYHKALSLINEVIKSDLEIPDGYVKRANVKVLLEQYLSALDDVYIALSYDSENAEAFNVLAEINAFINNRNEFYLNLEKALKIDPLLVGTSIKEKEIYKNFFNDKRFLKIIEKYNLSPLIEGQLNNNYN